MLASVGAGSVVVVAVAILVAVAFAPAPPGPPHAFADGLPTAINLTVAGRISDDDSLNLDVIEALATFASAGRDYLAVTSHEGMQVLDLTDPYNIVPAGLHQSSGLDIETFESADGVYAATITTEGIQTFNLTDPYNIVPAGYAATYDDGLDHVRTPKVAIFESANRTYAIISSVKGWTEVTYDPLGAPLIGTIREKTITQVIDLTDPYNIFRADRISDDDGHWHAEDIATFELANRTYAVWISGSVFVKDVTDQHTLVDTDSISDSQGDLYLGYAWHGDTFKVANRAYAVVTAYWEDGVQVLDVTDPYNIVPADGIGDGEDIVLDGVRYIATFESASRDYAVVTSGEGIQVLDLTNPYNIIPAGHIVKDNNRICCPFRVDIDVFESSGRTYVVMGFFNAVQVIQLTGDVADGADGSTTDEPVPLTPEAWERAYADETTGLIYVDEKIAVVIYANNTTALAKYLTDNGALVAYMSETWVEGFVPPALLEDVSLRDDVYKVSRMSFDAQE